MASKRDLDQLSKSESPYARAFARRVQQSRDQPDREERPEALEVGR